jgi:hypothetical protein
MWSEVGVMENLRCEVNGRVKSGCVMKERWFANFVGQSGGLDD